MIAIYKRQGGKYCYARPISVVYTTGSSAQQKRKGKANEERANRCKLRSVAFVVVVVVVVVILVAIISVVVLLSLRIAAKAH